MSSREFSGRGDPARSMALLWGTAPRPTRGPKQQLEAQRIAAVAISVADAEGLAAVSMRRVADELGVGTMSLYTYVPGKPELLDLMLDTIYAELVVPEVSGDWRARVEARARADWALYLRHPWVLAVARGRGVCGPNELAAYEISLAGVAALGLSARELDSAVALVGAYVRGAATTATEAADAERATGQTDEAWWAAREPLVREMYDAAKYPTLTAISAQGAFDDRPGDGGYHWKRALDDFEFGLAAVLDGLAARLGTRSAKPAADGGPRAAARPARRPRARGR